MNATPEMIEAAVAAVSENVDWVNGLFGFDYDNAQEVMRDAINAALAVMPAAQPVAVPGWVLVPVEPTEAMLDAHWSQTGESKEMRSRTHAYMRRYYGAMLAAAPTP